jgi:hypothetical protein
MPAGAEAALIAFEKDNQTLTITIAPAEAGSILVILTFA